MRKGDELEIRPPDPARQSHALLEVLVCVPETERPDFGDAEADQRQRSQVFPQTELRFVRRVDGGEQPIRRLRHRRQVPTLPGQVQPQDREHDLEASAPDRGYRRGPLDGQRKLPFRLLQRSPGQFGRRGQRGELRVGRGDAGRECGEELMRGGGLPAKIEVDPVVRQQTCGQAPVPRRLGVTDRLDGVSVPGVPSGGSGVQCRQAARFGMPKLQLEQVGEQAVVAEPGPASVQRNDERPGLLQVLQDPLPARTSCKQVG